MLTAGLCCALSRDGAPADQSMDFIQIFVADDQMASDFFYRGRLGGENFILEQMKTQFQRGRGHQRDGGQEKGKSVECARQDVFGATPDREDAGCDQR